jgi:histidinol-phosphate aminotransferase
VPLNDNFEICTEDYRQPNGGIIFPNPNAPTGLAIGLDAIKEILDANPDQVVIVDEAYVDFGTDSAISLLDNYENLLVVQTFSKSRSMAGMRIGFAIGNEELISCLMNVRNSFNSYTMNCTSIAMGAAAVRDEAYFRETTQKIIETREWAKKELTALGFTYPDSKANFIFASHKSVAAEEIFRKLRERHIYVRYFNKPRINNYLRITIGTREEMKKLFEEESRLNGRMLSLRPGGDLDSRQRLRTERIEIEERKKQLLAENGFPAGYLNRKYRCDICKDTGYTDEGMVCSCCRQRAAEAYDWHTNKEKA